MATSGVDGFRVDATCLLVFDEQFRDNPPNPDFDPHLHLPDGMHLPQYTRDQPGTHAVLRMMRQVVDEYDDWVLLGEIYLPIEKLVTYYGSAAGPELHLPINLSLAWLPWEANALTDPLTRMKASSRAMALADLASQHAR